jgi:hypothetical protein
MKKQQIKKRDAANAVTTALDALFEAGVLHEVAGFIRDHHRDSRVPLDVLRNVAEEKSSEAFDAVYFANRYFQQEPKKKAREKLAVVEKAA